MAALAPQIANRATRRATRKWKFSLHDSFVTLATLPDLGPTNRIRWLHKARSRKVSLILDKPGSVSFTVPANHIEGSDIFGYEIVRCVVAHAEDKNGVFQPMWSGPIYTAKASEPGGKIEVTCVGWDQLLEKRELRNDVNFNKVTNGELAQIIINIVNNQYANDGYGIRGVAEDLLYGAGDFEDSSTWDPGGFQFWTAIGQVGIGDFPVTAAGVAPTAISGWQDCPPSGSHWLRTRLSISQNKVYVANAVIKSRQSLTVEVGSAGIPEAPPLGQVAAGFAVEPGATYTVAGKYRGTLRQTGNGASATGSGSAEFGLELRWYDSTGTRILSSTGTLVLNTHTALQPWVAETPFTGSFAAPSNAAIGALVIYAKAGASPAIPITPGSGTVDVLWDNIIVTKAADPGRRNFPIRSNGDDPFIINQMADASFETGSQDGVWQVFPAGSGAVARSTEWARSGKNSLKYSITNVPTTGEYGVRYIWTGGPGTTGTGPLYVHAVGNYLTAPSGSYVTMRVRRTDASLVNIDSWEAIGIFGAGQGEFELYVPALSGVVTNKIVIEFFVSGNVFTGNNVTFYIDDITFAQEHPPVPFYEGSQQSSRYYDKDSQGRGLRSMGPVFTRTYTRGTKLSQILSEMTDIEWGVDYSVDPITRKLDLYWGLMIPRTSLRGKGQYKQNVVFGYGVFPNNIANIEENHDGSKVENRVNTQGKVGWGLAQDFDSIDEIGLFENTIQLTDVTDPPPPEASILAVYAGSEVAMFSWPFKLFVFQPKRYISGSNVPMFGVDYSIGDLTLLRAKKNVINVGTSGAGQIMRIFGAEITIDDNTDGEIIDSLTTALSG